MLEGIFNLSAYEKGKVNINVTENITKLKRAGIVFKSYG